MEIIFRNLNRYMTIHNFQLEPHQLEALELCGELNGCIIAGGAPLAIYQCESKHIKDWDLYFDSNESREEAAKILMRLGFEEIVDTKLSLTYAKEPIVIQLVKSNFESVESVFQSFDFHVCCFAIEDNALIFTSEAKRDAEKKLININSIKRPGALIGRIARYGAKGFRPTTRCSWEIMKSIRSMPIHQLVMDSGES